MSTIQKRYLRLLALYKRVIQQDLAEGQEMWSALDALNSLYRELIQAILDNMELRSIRLKDRADIQKEVRAMSMGTQLDTLFCKDQLPFYEAELNSFGTEILGMVPRCVTHLSVRQMLLVLRVLRDLRIIAPAPIRGDVTFMGRNFSTSQQKHISAESLRKKYGQIDSRTLKEVKEILNKMISRLNEYEKA